MIMTIGNLLAAAACFGMAGYQHLTGGSEGITIAYAGFGLGYFGLAWFYAGV